MKITRKENLFLNTLSASIWDLPTPSFISYFWNFGSTLGLCLIIQIISGLFLSFYYISFSDYSFDSVWFIMRETWFGWLIRFIHMNGASMFFFFIYLHIGRGIYNFSFTNFYAWMVGSFIFVLLMAISFLGYVLPWGQMSYWGVSVITNLFSVIPLIGNDLVVWIWGGYSVTSLTLSRFYSLHFILPMLLSAIVLIHMIFIHQSGSSNSIGISSSVDKIVFNPFFVTKDLYFFFVVFIMFFFLCFYYPLILGDSINSIQSDPLLTPTHIQPEWYFLPFYAVLRSVSSKMIGVILMTLMVASIFFLPLFGFKFSSKFEFTRNLAFYLFVINFLYLMVLGALPAEEPFVTLCKPFSFMFFSFFFFYLN